METDEFWARVEALRQEVARRRFAGESPELHLRRGESLVEAVARVIAAERSRVPLRVDSVELWLTEDLAREYFYGPRPPSSSGISTWPTATWTRPRP
jgi:hypothetical protein